MGKEHVRRTPDCITQADERILELLIDADPMPAQAIQTELATVCSGLQYSSPYIGRRCKALAEAGFLNRRYDNYSLTEKGRAYFLPDEQHDMD